MLWSPFSGSRIGSGADDGREEAYDLISFPILGLVVSSSFDEGFDTVGSGGRAFLRALFCLIWARR